MSRVALTASTVRLKVLVDESGLKAGFARMQPEIENRLRIVLWQEGIELQNRLREIVPVASGKLRDSIRAQAPRVSAAGAFSEIVRVGDKKAFYPRILEAGQKAHDIPRFRLQRAGKVLAFEAGGEMVFTRRVHHPAQAPVKFVEQAVADRGPAISAAVSVAMKDLANA